MAKFQYPIYFLGKIRNVVRLEQIKEEQRKIEAEAKEQAKIDQIKKKQKEVTEKSTIAQEPAVLPVVNSQANMVESVSQIKKATVTEVGEVKDAEVLVDKAPILVDKAPEMEPQATTTTETEVMEESAGTEKSAEKIRETEPVSTSSLSDLKDAIESLGIAKSQEDTLKEIKKELEEYDEDVREMDEVKNLVSRLDLHESRAAKLLFGRVNKMLRKADVLVDKLQKKKEQIDENLVKMQETEFDGDDKEQQMLQDEQKEKIVTIQEIIEAVTKLQESPNQAKVDQIAQVILFL